MAYKYLADKYIRHLVARELCDYRRLIRKYATRARERQGNDKKQAELIVKSFRNQLDGARAMLGLIYK